jgi:phage terminase large subunit
MLTAASPALDRSRVRYHPHGEAPAFLSCRDKEVLYEGPAGTGKSYACLWKVHAAMLKYPGARALMVRKTLVSLTASALVTFMQRILTTGNYGVTFFGGSKAEPAQFRYPNGSRIVVGGMDNAAKIMSAEYDLAYVNEATELTENDWEAITTRLRYGVMPYQQVIADCNPVAPSHWLNQRALRGVVTRFGSRHEDNPTLWDHARGRWTERGIAYMEVLERLTGVRYQRLRLGRWVAAEGQVYEQWNPTVQMVRMEDVQPRLYRAWMVGGVDWGYTKPGVLQVWAVDGDGRMIRVAEVYRTRKTVDEFWVPAARRLQERWQVSTWFCDPSEPAYIAQFQAAGLNAVKGNNAIKPGIGAVQARLAVQPDGLPRLQMLVDALDERDERLAADALPWCSEQEIPEYVWARGAGGEMLKDVPVDENNHGMDAMRYAVAGVDLDAPGSLDPLLSAAFADLPGR